MMPVPRILLGLVMVVFLSQEANAAWFEASGQAVIENGNQKLARQVATQEAIKQALLFAGASVKSVQHMANGLLHEDRFEVRSGGDVHNIELIDERYENGVVSVSIRADIFPQDKTCDASDYRKSLAMAWFPIRHRQQASTGGIFDMGAAVTQELENAFLHYAEYARVKSIQPYYVNSMTSSGEPVMMFSRKTDSQFVLFGEILDLSLQSPKSAGLAFWQENPPARQFSLQVSMFDGQTGAMILQKEMSLAAPWEFDLHAQVMPQSQKMWDSKYGKSISSLLKELAEEIDEKISCMPAYGRILNVQNQQLQVNIGEQDGVEVGDELTLYQLNQFFDSDGRFNSGFKLHPIKVVITQVLPNTSVAEAAEGQYLANIQPNDFVARH